MRRVLGLRSLFLSDTVSDPDLDVSSNQPAMDEGKERKKQEFNKGKFGLG